jgi:hypothetical protein
MKNNLNLDAINTWTYENRTSLSPIIEWCPNFFALTLIYPKIDSKTNFCPNTRPFHTHLKLFRYWYWNVHKSCKFKCIKRDGILWILEIQIHK